MSEEGWEQKYVKEAFDTNWVVPMGPNVNELRAIESLYNVNPVTGEKLIDWRQLNYKYEIYDYTAAALRRNRINPQERSLNTDIQINPDEVVMISKDTAYYDDEGRVVRETINRPLSGPWDFLNTYIVNIYPDSHCRDFLSHAVHPHSAFLAKASSS